MKKIVFAVFFLIRLGGVRAAEAVMPPSTSLGEPTREMPESAGRYQLVTGKVPVYSEARNERAREIQTILKLDRETGKTWVLEIRTDTAHHFANRWVEVDVRPSF